MEFVTQYWWVILFGVVVLVVGIVRRGRGSGS